MIKILEHGVMKITCPNCKAKLQYEQEDIIMEKHPNSNCYIICPDCNNKIILNKRDKKEWNELDELGL